MSVKYLKVFGSTLKVFVYLWGGQLSQLKPSKMKTTYYYQISTPTNRKWDTIKPIEFKFETRQEAIDKAKELSKENKAEVRWSDNPNYRFSNGSYTNVGGY